MSGRALLGALAVAALMASPALADDCHLTIVTSLTASQDEAGGIVIPAKIDGHDELLLIDTAGIFSLLTETTAKDINISRRALNSQHHLTVGGNGQLLSMGAIAHSFDIGNIHADSMQFAIIPDDIVVPGVNGTLGPSVMANYDVEIDPAHNKVNLFSPNHCPGQAVYWTRTPYAAIPMRLDSTLHIIIPVELDGQVFDATIDTGSSTSWMIYGLASGSYGWSESTPGFTPAHDPGWYHYPFKSLSLNGVDIRNPHILVRKDLNNAGGRTALIIGMDVLSKLHTFISYSDHALYFTGANAPPPGQETPPAK